jgi:iron(III) transport system permease protein
VSFFAAFLIWPIFQVLGSGVRTPDGHFTFDHFIAIFGNRLYLISIRDSILLAIVTTTIAFVIALPLAYSSDRYDFQGKTFLAILFYCQ